MRLINVQTLTLQEFPGEIPKYAILSHTWGDDEVTFKDFTLDIEAAKLKKGFEKIQHCIGQTESDGLQYCWVDTCCIDKSSSAELSEAINSMFAWYRSSERCYIYLADVDVRVRQSVSLRRQLMRSRWFLRGWTLQELLAPNWRCFYDRNWLELAAQILHRTIEEASGIPIRTLRSFSPTSREDCVAVKMSWAANRQTTRVEDMAYCLMGIFDVNMPLLYGEGSKAFIRLQEEIMRHTHDHSIFCWSDPAASLSTYRGLLARSPVEFAHSKDIETHDPTYDADESVRNLQPHVLRGGRSYGMTNRGLGIELPLFSNRPGGGISEEYSACLGCRDRKFGHHCHLVLAKLNGEGQFARVDVHRHPACLPGAYTCQLEMLRTSEVFVHQNPAVPFEYTSSRIGKALIHFNNWHPESPPKILRVDPSEAWDGESRVIKFGIGKPVRIRDGGFKYKPDDLGMAMVILENPCGPGAFAVCVQWRMEGRDGASLKKEPLVYLRSAMRRTDFSFSILERHQLVEVDLHSLSDSKGPKHQQWRGDRYVGLQQRVILYKDELAMRIELERYSEKGGDLGDETILYSSYS
ncbi:heterokaryon incompatibility protein-domain-containing protein [Diplogelasinospora grovesii]|uniref:Heterokaryon incompatibility protein-domain-containing protein n=1 Tax=Diplogelasinospora grovesii TaxID=303347 RepID=A0AAN6S3G4_9PEZI|nr:heterokaryon incompatibility protein-domain-containing protein [Diplogelasinospora grovesii]